MADISQVQRAVLLSNPWFAAFDARLRDAILERGVLKNLASGQRLFSRGDAPDGWYCVLGGAVKVRNTSRDGREVVLTYLEPGFWFGEISLVDGLPRTHDNVAHGPTLVLMVPASAFSELMQAWPQLAQQLLRMQSQRLRLLFAALEELSTLPTEQRLARQLLSLARTYGRDVAEGRVIGLKLPQDELAQLLGVTRQSINRILKTWERDGKLRQHYGEILLVDEPALQREAA